MLEGNPPRVFVDTETTGLDSRMHAIWEVALIIRDVWSDDDEEVVWHLRPTGAEMAAADSEGLKINRFHGRFAVRDGWDAARIDPADGSVCNLTRNEALFEIQDALRDRTLIAANAAFDVEMLHALMRKSDLRTSWKYRPYCVESMVAGKFGWPLPMSLKDTAAAMQVPFSDIEAHSALYDARVVRNIYDAARS